MRVIACRTPWRLHYPTPSRTITPTSHGSQILSPILVITFRTPRRPCNPALSCTITPTSHVPRIQTCMGVRDFGCPAPGNCATVTDNYPIPSRLPDPSPMVIEDFGRTGWGGLLGNCAFIKKFLFFIKAQLPNNPPHRGRPKSSITIGDRVRQA